MAIIVCPVCKGGIPDQAVACQKCEGSKALRNQKTRDKNVKGEAKKSLVSFLGIIAAIAFGLYWFLPPEVGQLITDQLSIKPEMIKEQLLYEKVRKIPASEVIRNRDGYRELMGMNPTNPYYRKKYEHYRLLAKSKGLGGAKSSSLSSYENHNSEFINTLRAMETAGDFTRDHQTRSIYVETNFWDTMDYQKKHEFCSMLQKTYPIYAQSILDNSSGRKLVHTNVLGEISVIQ